ncbi:DUF2934 domain-containing protein [Methylobacterium haplocladii]|uniref:DUF2934 domain-containing protein n=1 Tax=Methylobacterium haplocladii TaxID=1176176 RepID=A0A512ILP2_9HYPH|nr:DUF2934 domain-containing protein [Methylobacterium haplocladii]GEO98633.1 hypothetical protein MHA02_10210 [Methylobacterium haplocladii]GJD83966.1 hypothetical protein HPGCJGGD_1841 [Methylobacterium haplocladii]GLS59472.1 hypothetical protein GCM10007887_21410 [Methylobacterium haplocladii]
MDMIEHRVRERAYYIWEGEGRVTGRADAHWLQAEAEFAAAGTEITPAAAASVSEAATKVPGRSKAAAPKVAAKTSAKTAVVKAPKAVAAKAPAKPQKTARAEVGVALH